MPGGVLCLCVLSRRCIFVRLTRFRDENIDLCGLFFGSGDIFFRFLHISSYSWAICGRIFAHFGGYCGSFCVCARVCEYSFAYDYLYLRHCSIRRFCGYFEAVFWCAAAFWTYFSAFCFDASLIPAGESAHKPGTGRRLWGGATVSLAVCAEDLEFFVILPPQNARFSRLVPVTRIFLCGLAVCFLGRLEEGGGVGLFCDGIDCRDEPIAKFLPYPARSGVILRGSFWKCFENSVSDRESKNRQCQIFIFIHKNLHKTDNLCKYLAFMRDFCIKLNFHKNLYFWRILPVFTAKTAKTVVFGTVFRLLAEQK